MKSVDALRKWADGLCCIWIDPNDHSIIVTTCDDMPPSIDCVSLRDHVNGILDGIEREAAAMVPLPVDADGVPIHVGDVMENIVCPSVHREVTGVGVECFYGWDEGNGRYSQFDVVCYRHHHAPTVEDLIRDAILSCIGHSPEYWDEPIAECAAKLGRGECHEIMIDRFFRWCGECGYMWEYMYSIGKRVRPNFCPNYGAKVVSDG